MLFNQPLCLWSCMIDNKHPLMEKHCARRFIYTDCIILTTGKLRHRQTRLQSAMSHSPRVVANSGTLLPSRGGFKLLILNVDCIQWWKGWCVALRLDQKRQCSFFLTLSQDLYSWIPAAMLGGGPAATGKATIPEVPAS